MDYDRHGFAVVDEAVRHIAAWNEMYRDSRPIEGAVVIAVVFVTVVVAHKAWTKHFVLLESPAVDIEVPFLLKSVAVFYPSVPCNDSKPWLPFANGRHSSCYWHLLVIQRFH